MLDSVKDQHLRDKLERLEPLQPILEALNSRLGGVHLVGGAVRDLLLGREPNEVDLVVVGDAIDLARQYAELLPGSHIEVHQQFGTATVRNADAVVDFATARVEQYESPGALPVVRPATLAEDLRRRDFTVNSMAISLEEESRGLLTDPFNGIDDLAERLLRVLHRQSFVDDPTRLWRLARYAGRYQFQIEALTAQLASDAVANGALAGIAAERSGNEILRLLEEAEPLAAIDQAVKLGLPKTFGVVAPATGLAERALERFAGLIDPETTVAIAFWADADGASSSALSLGMGARFAALAAQGERISEITRQLEAAVGGYEIAELVSKSSPEAVAIAGVNGAEANAARWFDELQGLTNPVDGDQLLAAGIKAGPAIAVGLEEARRSVLNGEQLERAELLKLAVDAASDYQGKSLQ